MLPATGRSFTSSYTSGGHWSGYVGCSSPCDRYGARMITLQHFDYNGVDVTFYNFDEDTHSVAVQPRDIHIIEPVALRLPAVVEEIVENIRLHTGHQNTETMKHNF